jgi:rubrerythrin
MNRFLNKIFTFRKNTSKTWECSNCHTKFYSTLGREIPEQCRMCGGICFEKVE